MWIVHNHNFEVMALFYWTLALVCTAAGAAEVREANVTGTNKEKV